MVGTLEGTALEGTADVTASPGFSIASYIHIVEIAICMVIFARMYGFWQQECLAILEVSWKL